VGIPDTIAGEIPAVIVKPLESWTKSYLCDQVKDLGPAYTLGPILTLKELELKSFPMTSTGKIQKHILKERVVEYLGFNSISGIPTASPHHDPKSLVTPDPSHVDETSLALEEGTQQLHTIWADISGFKPEVTEPMMETSDSITLMRYGDKVFK
jgi:hypothetical protein